MSDDNQMNTDLCYKKKNGEYLGKFLNTVEHYPEGYARGGVTTYTFKGLNGDDVKDHTKLPNISAYEVVPCQTKGGKRTAKRTRKNNRMHRGSRRNRARR